VKASAPGKIILLGEHAVVYGRPAVAVPVPQVRAEVQVARSPRPGIWIDAPDIGLRGDLDSLPDAEPLPALVGSLLKGFQLESRPDLRIEVHSTIPVASGLGSGAAVSVALTRAMAGELRVRISDEQVSAYAFEIEKLHHGTPSGIDNTVVTYGRPIFFARGQPPELLDVGASLTFVIADTGIAAPTRAAVEDVRRLRDTDVSKWEAVFDEIGSLVILARDCIQNGDVKRLGTLLDRDQALLAQLQVSSPELDRLILASRKAGALGAKLSGGGRGGNMIALVTEDTAQTVAAALTSAGARRVIVAALDESSPSAGDPRSEQPQSTTGPSRHTASNRRS
jgi:mevalonate kinase